jgi:hypothetical protein
VGKLLILAMSWNFRSWILVNPPDTLQSGHQAPVRGGQAGNVNVIISHSRSSLTM